MNVFHKIRLWCIFLFILLFLLSSPAFARGLDIYLQGKTFSSQDIVIIPVSIRHGLESQISTKWPLSSGTRVYTSKYFKDNQKKAHKSGVKLSRFMKQFAAYGYKKNRFFFLFYKFFKAQDCPRNYLIQRVKIHKTYLDKNNIVRKIKTQYLVEVFKLNRDKETKRADEHIRSYALGQSYRRKIVVECEIGCGVIPRQVEGGSWPFESRLLYKKMQDYGDRPTIYDQVQFDFSTTYKTIFEFDKTGGYSIHFENIPRLKDISK